MNFSKEQYKTILETIIREINKVIALVMDESDGREKEARELFNKELYKKFHTLFFGQDSPFEPLLFLYDSIDKYLNNEGARILGGASKKRILEEYSEFEENIEKVREKIDAVLNKRTA